MVQSYIRRNATYGTNGKQMNISIDTLRRVKGVTPNTINIPGLSAESQVAIPIRGQQDSFEVVIRITTESSTVAFDVNLAGSTSAYSSSVTSIKDQYNFLYTTLLASGLDAQYILYIEWLDLTFTGSLLLSDQQISENFGNEVRITLNMTAGQNFIYNSVVGS